MVQSPSWEGNWFAASQEIPRISRNPMVHYRTHERPPSVSILGQPNPVHIPTFHLLEIHPNIIHPSTPRSSQWSLIIILNVNSFICCEMRLQKVNCQLFSELVSLVTYKLPRVQLIFTSMVKILLSLTPDFRHSDLEDSY